MKIRFVKTVLVDVQKVRLDETWDKTYRRWDEVRVDNIIDLGEAADLVTYDGDILKNVPRGSFEVMK